MSGRQAGATATAAGARRLVVTHLWPTIPAAAVEREAADAFGGPVDLARPSATGTRCERARRRTRPTRAPAGRRARRSTSCDRSSSNATSPCSRRVRCSSRWAGPRCCARPRSRTGCRRGCAAAGKGWVTAEYSLLPGSSAERIGREAAKGKQSGRTQEIQRLIGRSLRAVTDLVAMGELQVTVDCDVLQADGGTRTASICGAYVALHDASPACQQQGPAPQPAAHRGLRGGVGRDRRRGMPARPRLLARTRGAEVDMNVVMTGSGRFIEVQGTAEGAPFSAASSTTCSARPSTGSPRSSTCSARSWPSRPPRDERERGRAAPGVLRLVLATANPDKAAEIAAIVDDVSRGRIELVARPAVRGRGGGDRRHPGGQRPAQGPGPGGGHRAAGHRRRHRPRGRRARRCPGRALVALLGRARHLRRQRGQAAGRARGRARRRARPAGPASGRWPWPASPAGARSSPTAWSRDTSRRRRGARAGSATTRSSSPTAGDGRPSPRCRRPQKHACSHRGRAFRALAVGLVSSG